MVKKYDNNGEVWHEPPYSWEELQQLDQRIYRSPISFMRGERPTTLPAQRESLVDVDVTNYRIKAEDRAKLDLAEAIRGYIDVQNVSSWYINLDVDAVGETDSLFVPFDRPLTSEEISALRAVGQNHQLIDLADSGHGATMTTFGGALNARTLIDALNSGLVSEIRRAVSDAGEPYRIHTESGCHNYGPLWRQGEGSGAATQYLLDQVDQANLFLREILNDDARIPQVAIARMERDAEWAIKLKDRARPDIQNARRIIGEGKGWTSRLKSALACGELLP
jgi:hypothetical protein